MTGRRRTRWTRAILATPLAMTMTMALGQGCARPTPVPERTSSSIVAFSLGRARTLTGTGVPATPEVATLGHIGRLLAVVFDAAAHDVILVGALDTAGAAMRFEDLAVAMRAAARNQWPLVSIDPTPEMAVTGLQRVRMEGGVEDTPFGRDLLALDVWLKRSALGTIDTSLVSYFDLRGAIVGRGVSVAQGASRIWFRVLDGRVEERQGIFALDAMRIGVLTERVAEGAKALEADAAADQFAQALTNSYETLAGRVHEVRRLRPMYQAVAVAEAIRALPEQDWSAWLQAYPVARVETARTFKLESRAQPIATVRGPRTLRISGGVELKSLVLRARDRDVTALRDAVLLSRPSAEALTWTIPLMHWEPTSKNAPEVAGVPTEKLGSRLQWEVGGSKSAAEAVSSTQEHATQGMDSAVGKRGGISVRIEIGSEDVGARPPRQPRP